MKKFYLLIAFSFWYLFSNAATCTATTGDWDVPGTWSAVTSPPAVIR